MIPAGTVFGSNLEKGMRQLARWFVQGLIVLLPIVTTIWVLTNLFVWVDDLFPIRTPGLGFVLAVITVTLVGWLTSLFIGRWLVRGMEWLLEQIPLVRSLYHTVKDFFAAVSGQRKTFDRPVVVTLFPGGDAKVLGFVTREDLKEIGLPGEVAVLLQQSLNFAGNLIIFPKAQVRPLDVDSGKFLTFLMSGGLTGELVAPPKSAEGAGTGAAAP
jgi:uncharacterized membrane protein